MQETWVQDPLGTRARCGSEYPVRLHTLLPSTEARSATDFYPIAKAALHNKKCGLKRLVVTFGAELMSTEKASIYKVQFINFFEETANYSMNWQPLHWVTSIIINYWPSLCSKLSFVFCFQMKVMLRVKKWLVHNAGTYVICLNLNVKCQSVKDVKFNFDFLL